ncbi:MAG: hypothetical protein PF904_13155 [Kiritimatiellae bacterium]|nr:hypothetical protein [Kiritimatiellia bacterium]
MKKRVICFILIVGAFLVSGAGAEVSAVSDDALLDTRMLSSVVVIENQDLDTRSYTVDLSDGAPLNTQKIIGSLIIIQ